MAILFYYIHLYASLQKEVQKHELFSGIWLENITVSVCF